MTIELDRKDLKALVKGSGGAGFGIFNNPLVIRAGHSYSDQYGRTKWGSLDLLTDDELMKLYQLCKNSWLK